MVETTKDGEISKAGRNSKPFGSSSAAVGGYFINQHLAARAFEDAAGSGDEQRTVRASLRKCLLVMQGRAHHHALSDDDSAFFDNYQWVVHFVEKAKRLLTATVNRDPRGWSRDEPPAADEWIELPLDSYDANSEWRRFPISTSTFMEVFLTLGTGADVPKPVALKPIGGSTLPDLHAKAGAMIEAATDMRAQEGKRLEWKVVSALSRPKHIKYYFHASAPDELQSDPSRTESRLNFDQWELNAPGTLSSTAN